MPEPHAMVLDPPADAADDPVYPATEPSSGSQSRCLVVMYHYVHDDDPLPRRAGAQPGTRIARIGSAEFEAQVDSLCRRLEPIDWPLWLAFSEGRASIPARSFLLTFDDGLADHMRIVVPALQRRGLRGVFFVPGAVLTSHCLLPAHAIHMLLATLDEGTLEQELGAALTSTSDTGAEAPPTGTVEAARTLYHYETPARARLKYWLTMQLPAAIRNQIVRTLFERHIGSLSRWARHWYLGWEDLVEMESMGHTIGGHGFRHEPLTQLSPVELRRDLHRVASVLHNGLGPDVRPFSYPYGRHNDEVCAACRDEGFAQAFATTVDWAESSSDPFRLPRVDTVQVPSMIGTESACPVGPH
jgi:peptidoglycan/xylan/chitin deacetylase (PgdA/CDA1 family)